MYADNCTDSMLTAITESNRRRQKQVQYNMEHGILPRQARKSGSGQSLLLSNLEQKEEPAGVFAYPSLTARSYDLAADVSQQYEAASSAGLDEMIAAAREAMEQAAKQLDFMAAARHRDRMQELERLKSELDKRK